MLNTNKLNDDILLQENALIISLGNNKIKISSSQTNKEIFIVCKCSNQKT